MANAVWVTLGATTMVGALAFATVGIRRMVIASQTSERLSRSIREEGRSQSQVVPKVRPALRLSLLLLPLSIIIAFPIFLLVLNLPLLLAIAFTAVVFMIVLLAESTWYERRLVKLEVALADAVDLIVSALHAGSSVLVAIDHAGDEAPPRLRHLFDEMIARIRFGDDPHTVFENLSRRVPLESFRLFALSLSVHWEVGGSLAPVLASIGRTIRDRIEVARRTRAMTTQARVSIITVVVVTYLIALGMYQMNPDRVTKFVESGIGEVAVAITIILQVIGIIWVNRMAKARF